jgi:hypothetical protein
MKLKRSKNKKKVNSKVIDSLGRKISSEDAVLIDGIFYDATKNNPPLIIMRKNHFGYSYPSCVLFDEESCIKYKNKYYHKNDMIKIYLKDGKELIFSDRNDACCEIGEEKFSKLIPGRNQDELLFFETLIIASKRKFGICLKDTEYLKPLKECVSDKKDKVQYKKTKFSASSSDSYTKKEAIKLGVSTATTIGTGGLDYTFGIEIETISGKIPDWQYKHNSLNLDAVHDGSLRDEDGNVYGGEYVTGVLKGDAGLANLYRCVKTIHEYCSITKQCGIHVHVGGANFNEKFTIDAYLLGLQIEREIFEIFPPSRRTNDYTGFLKKWDFKKYISEHGDKYGYALAWEALFKDMANMSHVKNRELGENLNRFINHPGGRYTDRYSHNVPLANLYRYKWLNLITCNFNTRNVEPKKDGLNNGVPFTLEFRPHSASMNFKKIKNWLLFCMAYVNYVENNSSEIIKRDDITISDILTFTYGKTKVNHTDIINYFEERKNRFKGNAGKTNELLEYSEKVSHNATRTREIINT